MRQGHCLCGAVRWEAGDHDNWTGYCHCESCRRNCAAPVTAYLGVPRDGFRWTGEVPARYASAPGVTRSFCARCGTPMAYENTRWPDEIHLYAATLERPEAYSPGAHFHHAERLPWLHIEDELKRHDATAP